MSVERGTFDRERALLFFDDQYLDRRDNLDRRLGQPVPVPEGTWRDPDLDPSWGYPSVFADPASGLWRCLYQAQLPRSFVPEGGRLRHLALAVESEDGVRWRAPDLTQAVPMEGRVRPHQVLPLGRLRGMGALLPRRAHRRPRRAPEGVRQLPRSGRYQCAAVRVGRRPLVAPAAGAELASDRHRPGGVRILESGAQQLRDRRSAELGRPPHRGVRDARLAHLLGAGGGDAPGRRGYAGGAGVRHAGVPLRPPVHRLPVDLPHHAGGRRQQVHRRQGGLSARLQLQRLALPALPARAVPAARRSAPSPATAASTPPAWS